MTPDDAVTDAATRLGVVLLPGDATAVAAGLDALRACAEPLLEQDADEPVVAFDPRWP